MVVLSGRIEDPHIQRSLEQKLKKSRTRWRIIWLVILIALLGALSYFGYRYSVYGKAKAQELIQEAQAAEQQLELTKAASLYEQAIALGLVARQSAGEAAYREAALYASKSDYSRAQELLIQAEKLDRHNARFSSALGRAYLATRTLDQAKEAFDRALSKEPDLADAKLGLARVAYERGDFTTGDAQLKTVADADNPSDEATYLDAIRGIHENPQGALESLDRIIGQSDNKGFVATATTLRPIAQQIKDKIESKPYEYTVVGAALIEHNEPALALLELDQATEADQEYRDAWTNKAEANYLLGNLDAATDAAQRAVDIDPTFGFTQFIFGQVELGQNQLDQAAGSLLKALSFQYVEPQVYLALADVYEAQSKPGDAIDVLQTAVDQGDADETVFDRLYWLHIDDQDYRAALKVATSFGEFDKRSTTAQGLQALAYAYLGESDKARDLADSLLARDPLSAVGSLVAGMLDHDQSRLEKARDVDFGGRIAAIADEMLASLDNLEE